MFWYLLNPSAPFHHSWWFMLSTIAMWELVESGHPEGIQLTYGLNLLATLERCNSSLKRAFEVKPHTGRSFGLYRQRRHPGCMFPPSLKHRKSL